MEIIMDPNCILLGRVYMHKYASVCIRTVNSRRS